MIKDLSENVVRVTSFSEGELEGNPAGVYVCGEEGFPREEVMQQTAAVVGYSETAFVSELKTQPRTYDIRYFTPKVEVPLCGHATLAAAWVLGDKRAVFTSGGGKLETWASGDGMVWMDFPELPVGEKLEGEERAKVLDAMGLRYAVDVYSATPSILVILDDERKVFSYQSKLGSANIGSLEVQGVAITTMAPEGRDYDFVSRYFAPNAGVPEDPVTGSLHCSLAPFWGAQLGLDDMVGYQASDRGGFVHVKLPAEKPGRVLVGGFVRRMELA